MFEGSSGILPTRQDQGPFQSTRKRTQETPLTSNSERAKYAALDYAQRLDSIGKENAEVKGILIEWRVDRMEDDCAQTLLKYKP